MLNAAAAAGTVQLSSPRGISSTSALAPVMVAIRVANVWTGCGNDAMPAAENHIDIPIEAIVAPAQNARDPTTDLDREKNHLLFLPNLRPIMSATPSPTAIVHRASTPTNESVQKRTIEANRIRQYTKGPPNASSVPPLRETAFANSVSPSPLPAKKSRIALVKGTQAANHRPLDENMGHKSIKTGAENVWMSFLES
mmetsp:Transcript_6712/g.11720  ORF Transcript_6712/g.11720 Transcript_6712/m.11720 type:complete len:197 (-) Transcript_6712:122-712(-)